MRAVIVAYLVFMLASLAGCGRHAVRASEKEFLADPIMTFDEDPQEESSDDHILSNREGAAGGHGAGGGGCGCN
jgi:hypothetical protein